MMSDNALLAIVLAAGQGTRMRSAKPKVLHAVAGRPMLGHVVVAARAAGADTIAVVVAPKMDSVRENVRQFDAEAQFFEQAEPLGTAHAVLAARAALEGKPGTVLVLCGDTPLLQAETLAKLAAAVGTGAGVAILGFEAADPFGYGRLLLDADGQLTAIREEKDATDAERAVRLCHSGVLAIRGSLALGLLDRVGNANAKGEYYLTDIVGLAGADGVAMAVVRCPETEVMGVNTRVQLAEAEAVYQTRRRRQAMLDGATLIDPQSVMFSADTELDIDVTIEPHVVFGPSVRVERGATIRAFSHLEECLVGEGAVVGPYARIRPGTEIGAKARVGNFVELKAAKLAAGAKVNHLTYLGDAVVGADANIGAGTITCNYDGFQKYQTVIGAGAFIGSNSALVAPVEIGAGAYVGSGSVVTENVEADALAVARGRQVIKPGWAKAFRAKFGKA